MNDILHNFDEIRFEISFNSFDELRTILNFYQRHNLNKINIPCKNSIKKDFLLSSIKILKDEFPNIDLIPHFSILHEFRRNRINTQESFIKFLQFVKSLGCKEVLLVSGSQKRKTLDSVSTLYFLKDSPLYDICDFSIGVAFNPYLPELLFKEEIERLTLKLQTGLVNSIWIQFGTDYELLKSRIEILRNIINSTNKKNLTNSLPFIFGSILIPSKQFLARFKYRPWKGVYCSSEFLDSVDFANKTVKNILLTYKQNNINPVIETGIYNEDHLKNLKNIFLDQILI